VEWRVQRALSVNLLTWIGEPGLAADLSVEERRGRVQAADEIVAQLFEAQRAWVSAVAARQSARYLEDVVAAAEVSRDLMQSMRRVGNASELDALRGQRFYAEAIGHLTHAQATAAIERERLAQALGLWGPDAERMQLPDRLPDLPATAIGPEGLEARAIAQRFDLRAARVAGSAEEAAINARADLRTAWLSYRAAHELAQHARAAVVPLAERMSAEQLKRYNGMLIGVFDLIADAADRINTVNIALDAERSFWLAEIDLQQALTGVGTPAPGGRSRVASGFGVPSLQHVH
jgi:outer membrane protein TolC